MALYFSGRLRHISTWLACHPRLCVDTTTAPLAAIASSLLAGAVCNWWEPQATVLIGAGAAGLAATGLMAWTKRTEGNAMNILLEN